MPKPGVASSLRPAPLLLVLLAVPVGVHAQAPVGQAPAKPAPAAARPQARPVVVKGPRPEQFTFKPLTFNPPKAADFRTQLSSGGKPTN